MSNAEETFEYKEDAAVEFIHNYLPQDLKEKFPEDTIYYILDLICEFYEKNDFLSDDDEKVEEEMIAFIVQQAHNDAIGDFLPDDISLILRAEEAYMESLDDLDDFDDEDDDEDFDEEDEDEDFDEEDEDFDEEEEDFDEDDIEIEEGDFDEEDIIEEDD